MFRCPNDARTRAAMVPNSILDPPFLGGCWRACNDMGFCFFFWLTSTCWKFCLRVIELKGHTSWLAKLRKYTTPTWWWSIHVPGHYWPCCYKKPLEEKSFLRSYEMKMDFSIWPIISKRSASREACALHVHHVQCLPNIESSALAAFLNPRRWSVFFLSC